MTPLDACLPYNPCRISQSHRLRRGTREPPATHVRAYQSHTADKVGTTDTEAVKPAEAAEPQVPPNLWKAVRCSLSARHPLPTGVLSFICTLLTFPLLTHSVASRSSLFPVSLKAPYNSLRFHCRFPYRLAAG